MLGDPYCRDPSHCGDFCGHADHLQIAPAHEIARHRALERHERHP